MTNKLIVPNADLVIEQMKNEIAAEFGIELNGNQSARNCGRVGGELTKRLVELGKQSLLEQGINHVNVPQHMYNQVQPSQNQLH